MITISAAQGGIYFSLFYFLSVLFALIGFMWMVHRNNLPVIPYALTFLSAVLFMLIGTKIFTYSFDDWNYIFNHRIFPHTDHKTVLGGITGAIFGLMLAKKTLGIQESLTDRFALLLPVGMVIQRLGCLFAGCCFGNVTSLPWGITYGKDSIAYHLQLKDGLITNEATTSLPVHPDQLYHIIFCSLIALIVWKKSNFLQAKGNKFLFSILLYLVFRFFEEFTRFTPHQFQIESAAGLKQLQWILIFSITVVALIIFLKELYFRKTTFDQASRIPFYKVVLLFTSILFLIAKAGDWFIPIERIVLWFITLPLLFIVSWKLFSHFIFLRKYQIGLTLILITFIFTSQTGIQAPKDSLASYFTVTASAFSGKFIHFHENPSVIGSGCGGGLEYKNRERFGSSYNGGAVGIGYTQWLAENSKLNVGLNMALGNNSERSVDSSKHLEQRQSFTDVNPFMKVDFKWIGFGLGLHAGSGYFTDNSILTKKISGSYSFRFGPLKALFLEYAHADGLSGLCEKSDEWNIGSSFGRTDLYFKIGDVNRAIAFQALIPITKDWQVEPYIRFGDQKPQYDNYTDHVSGSAYRLTLLYNFKRKYHAY